ncbi:MAG: preprotein translocase subunit YajC [Gammaproteobacteria bacterium]|nr:preprotein translocase subunit YajC [Gammaproteobacteria bacterium]
MSLLDLLISPAAAQAAPAAGGSALTGLLLPLVFIGVMFFLMIRPQMKRAKEHRELIAKLAKGDEVITNGGIAGRIDDLGDAFVTVEIADNVRVKLQRAAIVAVLPKGTLKSA